ncbi:NirD/YgiW/YdeI family stress tolerance protein [Vibrio cholerae]|uniref:NirD/YgiW/YdeI family stress tolerance protein n=1 Tax=Vibrio cholerae TaxID=666 RepID=UPI0004E345E0|nr:NirD/YgiW/YdeI family stress tolerance protein [Vibrio cholerae]EGQ7704505.1 NirD/YgiW/YdeI family stress tolerance protein [Vibrio cholerae]EGR0683651.1 NirD/YgiW/YdeI family stress tolerance protein [Vibrio cholerae]EGR1041660.1 NirD/YgiW/YdeI family stress tolerance protein [Vibrio cholerae]EGR1091115.1 NirD/YgiW/YdeI family stress tolerance protein [Vibrio cholerae]EHK7541255.1 NirD/YgiW/YdeI family stress tolerance protein [Vibrio cholerae]
MKGKNSRRTKISLYSWSRTFALIFSLLSTNMSYAGFTGPSEGINTVSGVLNAGIMSDDTPVTLTGFITSSLGGDLYRFADSTGDIIVEIESDKWFGVNVTPETKVTIWGEIEKEFRSTRIDVSMIRLAN